MEAHTLALAGGGVLLGWFLNREAPKDPLPVIASLCGCSLPENRQDQ